ncbi:MAG TPA: DUF72 domain-containing protein [Candidatus Limnocylindrales bacterium]|nr:DUF72 domain-containing protein [Candidatus Limnocylindrales bacterium]
MTSLVRIGTSGWDYRHWAGRFYPRDLPRDGWLDFYARRFDTVELNNSFYRLPDPDTFAAWAGRVSDDFVFAVKASRYLTHLRRLRDPEEALERLWNAARRLGGHLGPVLYQLPPRWRPNPDRLAAFLDAVPRDELQVIEIRDRRWYGRQLNAALDGAGVALCLHDMPGSEPRPEQVGPFVYVRFHGSGTRYGGRYTSQRLTAWAARIAGWATSGSPVWAYFNNDIDGHAIRDADRLMTMLARRGVT